MPQPVIIILIVIGALLILGLLFSVFFTFLVAYKVYSKTLMRDKNSHWGREHCSEPGNPALETMWKRGLEWSKKDKSFIKELSIKSYPFLNKIKFGRNVTRLTPHISTNGYLAVPDGKRYQITLIRQRMQARIFCKCQKINGVITPVQEIGGNDTGLLIFSRLVVVIITTAASTE